MKPEFFEDEDIGMLSREARLLFIASWVLADDEGLLRWSGTFMKANVFMYDDDLDIQAVERAMGELEEGRMVMPYRGGKSQQRLGWIINFRRHQRINRPQEGRLPAPSIQNPAIVRAYCERDRWVCAVCNLPVEQDPVKRKKTLKVQPSIDHIEPKSKGGSDYPSNLRLAHQGCNASRGVKPVPPAMNDSLNGSVPEEEEEGEEEREEEQGKGKGTAPLALSFGDWLEHYRTTTGRQVRGSKPAKDAFRARVRDGYSLDELKLATVGCHGDKWCREHGHDVPETILRASKINRYIELAKQGPADEHPADKRMREMREIAEAA